MFKTKSASSSILNSAFKISELKKALNKCRNTAPGQDLLCYEMFRHLSLSSKEFLVKYFNKIWSCGILPSSWKHSIIVPILKPGKVKSDPASYRPIALTSNLCKLYERMIVYRLQWFLEKKGLLNINQSGFRKKRRCLDQLLRLSDDILKGFGQRYCTLAVFLDFEKAYDMIWRNGVLYKLHLLGVDGQLFNWIKSFLESRTFQVRVGSTLSDVFNLLNGVPQGQLLALCYSLLQ